MNRDVEVKSIFSHGALRNYSVDLDLIRYWGRHLLKATQRI
jgi:hypothetical protein